MRNVFEWIGMKKEEQVLKCAQDHLAKVQATITALNKAIEFFVSGDTVQMKQQVHLVADYEHEADLLRRKLINDIAKGEVSPKDREDLIHFVSRVDAIADWAHTADRLLALWEGKFPEDIGKELKDFMGTAVSAVDKLQQAVHALGKEPTEKILKLCSEVESAEEVADDQKRDLLRLMIKSGFDAAHMIIFHDLIEAIEWISDSAEIVADSIRILAVELE